MRVIDRHWQRVWAEHSPESDAWPDPVDRRITRSWRLNALWSALVMLRMRVQLVAGAVVAALGIVIVLTLRATRIWN
jgi:hypothetical protein